MVLVGDMDTGWKPGGGRMSGKSSFLSDDAASSSPEDMSTTASCRHVMCAQMAYANSKHRGVAFCFYLRRSFCRIWGGRFPRTNRMVSSAEKKGREGRSSTSCEPFEFNIKPVKYYFVAGH